MVLPQPRVPANRQATTRCGRAGRRSRWRSQDVLSIQEVAKLLKVPVSAIYAWNRRGVGPPFYKVGSKLRYRKSYARKWLANHLVSRAVCSSECGQTYRRSEFTQVEG